MGWLSNEVQETLRAWINAHSVDAAMGRPDWHLAGEAMAWRRRTHDGDQMTSVLSIVELLDGIEGSSKHVLHIEGEKWKIVHPLDCRLRGLIRCDVEVDPELMEDGEYVLSDGAWVLSSSSLSLAAPRPPQQPPLRP